MDFPTLYDFLVENEFSTRHVDIRRVDPMSFTKDNELFTRLSVSGKRMNYFFTIIKDSEKSYYLKIKMTYDFYTYRRAGRLKKPMEIEPQRLVLKGCYQAWDMVKEFLQNENNWNKYFDESHFGNDTPNEVKIHRVLFHSEKYYENDRRKRRWIRQFLRKFLSDNGATIKEYFMVNKMSRDIEAKLSEPITLTKTES